MNPPTGLFSLLGLDRTMAWRAVSLAFAAWLSFALASLLHVDNAYWAAMPVWVITQSSRGLLFERAALRVLGTLLGAGAGFGIVHLPIPPGAQLIALAIWMAFTAGLTQLLRGTHGYGALLAGMTAAIVVAPSTLIASEASIAVAMARVECTLIGVGVGTLVLAALTPAQPLADFFGDVRRAASEAVQHTARILRGAKPDLNAMRATLIQISQIEASGRLAVAASVEGYRRLHDVELAVVGALSLMAAVQARSRQPTRHDAMLADRLDAIARHLRRPWNDSITPELRHFRSKVDSEHRRLLLAVDQILDAEQGFYAPHKRTAPPEGRRAHLAPLREWPLARLNAATVGLATLTASAFGLWIPWESAWLVLLGVCIFVTLLGSMPLPQQIAPKMFTGTVIGVSCAFLYRLVIQPQLDTMSDVLLSLVPFMLAGGIIRVAPRTAVAGIDACMSFLLASQAGQPATADLLRIMSSCGALLIAAGVATLLFLLHPRRPLHRIHEAATTIRNDLLRMLDVTYVDAAKWQTRGARQILRLTLHLGREQAISERWPGGLLAALNLGHALGSLHAFGMPDTVRETMKAFLQGEKPFSEACSALQEAAATTNDPMQAGTIRAIAAEFESAGPLLAFDRSTLTPVPARRRPRSP